MDPTLRNKKITFAQFKNYLDQYYAALDDIQLAGNVTITGNLTVGSTISGNIIQATGTISGAAITGNTITATTGIFTTLSGTTITGDTAAFGTLVASGHIVQDNLTVSGDLNVFGSGFFASGINVTGVVSGATGLFTDITGSTLNITTPSGATPAIVCSGVVSGGTSGFIIQGPLVILP